MKITFKKEPLPTGLSRIGCNPYTHIKVAGMGVGTISRSETGVWVIRIAVKREPTAMDPAPFKWVLFKQKFSDEALAREYIVQNLATALEKSNYKIYQFE